MLETLYITLVMITSVPLGLFLSWFLKDEKPLVKSYFPPILWILAIAAAILFYINLVYFLTTTYLFFMVLTWWKLGK
ncbi:hypothetical protein CMI41_00250 [Candidatus Pacearchaeota archaeon]|nr:hypothetical protein [Candidatus Pacearchaeota archaeon]